MRRAPLEHHEQSAFIARVQWLRPALTDFVAAVPNGGARDKRTAARIKAEGSRPGFPDIVVMLARGGCFGLLIEMKRRDVKRAREEQDALHRLYRAQGYRVAVCSGADQAWTEFLRYVDDEPTHRRDPEPAARIDGGASQSMGSDEGGPFDV